MPDVRRGPTQADLFRHGPSQAELGRQKHEAAMRRFEGAYSDWLDQARATMEEVIRKNGNCTSDDCWALCPPPADAHPSLMGALFRDDRFLRVSAKKSERASANGRWISVYELKGEM